MAVATLILLAAACGSTGSNPTPSTPKGVLLLRAQQAFGAASTGSWEEVYQYVSPRSRERCTAEGFTTGLINYIRIVRGLSGLSEDAPLKLRPIISAVTGNVGLVAINFLSDGQRLNFQEDEQSRWVLIDGQWWLEHELWEGGCSEWKLFEELRELVPEKQN